MSLNRYAKRVDDTQAEIVKALRRCGATVWIISQPIDLLVYWRGRWMPLECKPVKKRTRKDQALQTALCSTYGVPVVRTAEQALQAVMGPSLLQPDG